jgi:hypothetical protein
MELKKCLDCSVKKPLSDFYKHKGMSDGRLNKCKECKRSYQKKREQELRKDESYVESEKKRHRDKYQRLNYKDKQKEWDKSKPWKSNWVYKSLNKKYKIEKGFEIHHWNYKDEFLENFFILEISEHRKAHKFLLLNLEKRIFVSDEGEFLDTKYKHMEYLKSKGIKGFTYESGN